MVIDQADLHVAVSCSILRTGTAAFLPTVVTASLEEYDHVIPILSSLITSSEFSGIALGIHLEGYEERIGGVV